MDQITPPQARTLRRVRFAVDEVHRGVAEGEHADDVDAPLAFAY